MYGYVVQVRQPEGYWTDILGAGSRAEAIRSAEAIASSGRTTRVKRYRRAR